MAQGTHQIIAAFDLLEETPILEEHEWLPLPLSEQRVPVQTGKNRWHFPKELLQDLGWARMCAAACFPAHFCCSGPPPSPWLVSEQSLLLPPFSFGAHSVGWAAAASPVPGCLAGAGASIVSGESISCISKGLIWSPFPCDPSDHLLAREIQVFKRDFCSLSSLGP